MAKGIPYGISDFSRLIDQNYYYVDKTHFIPQIEEIANYLFLIRPRRFGKSVFLTMMRAYYDISQKDRFEERFSNLWIGKHPTPLQGIYQMLYFDFSKANLGRGSLEDNFNNYCCIQLNDFFSTYREYYQGEKELEQIIASTEAATKLHWLEATARRLGHLLYLIIDEYDNFTNVILSEQGKNLFRDLTHASGFYREYFKQFKGMFERIFLMGVSPVTLDDLSSGYNIDWNISVDPHFNMMMGFSETDVREMFDYYQKEGMLKGDIDAMINEMKPWYDNYCFAKASLKTDPRMFNCDMTLYYLRHRVNFDASPEELVDKNIRTDYSKLKMLARLDHENVSGGDRMSTIEEIAAKGEILVNLHTSFPAEKIVETDNFRSLLYYYGLLTMCGTRGDRIVMCIPNNCVREQYFGFLREYYQQRKEVFLPHLKDLIDDMAFDGQWRPLFEYIALAQKYFDHIAELVRILVRTAENNGIIKTGGIVLDFPAYLCKKAVRDIGNNHTDRPRTSAPQTSGRIIRLIVEFVSHFPNAFGHLIAYAITFPLIIHDERHQRYRNSGSFGNVTNRCTFSFHIAHIKAFYRKYILKRFSCKINRQNFTHKLIKILIINALKTRSISITSSRHTP